MKKIVPLLSILMVLSLLSCTKENKANPGSSSVEPHSVLFSVEAGNPSTRATAAGAVTTFKALARERAVQSVHAVAFKKNVFYKSFKAEKDGSTGNYKFDMLQNGDFKVFLVANASSDLASKLGTNVATPGMLGNLVAAQSPGDDNTATGFLMTGEPFTVTTHTGTPANAGTIRLTRAASRFDFYNTVKGLEMTKLTFKQRAENTHLATGVSMSGIKRTDTKEYSTTEGLKAAEFIGGAYGYENTEVGGTTFILEGTFNGKAITPQEIVLEGIAVKRNHLYSIVIRNGNGTGGNEGDDDVTPGTDPGKLTFEVIVNDWNKGATLEWKGDKLVNRLAPSFIVTGEDITTTPVGTPDHPAVNPTLVTVGRYTATDLKVMVTSALSSSSILKSTIPLPAGYEIQAGPVGNKDGRLIQEFTIHLATNTTGDKSFDFVLSNVFDSSAKQTFTVKQPSLIALSYTVRGTNITTDPVGTDDHPATDPTSVTLPDHNAQDLTVTITSGQKGSTLTPSGTLPDGYTLTDVSDQKINNSKYVHVFTIHMVKNDKTAKKLGFVVTSSSVSSDKHTFTVTQPAYKVTRPKMPIEYVADTNVAPDGKSFVADNEHTNTSGYFTFDEAKAIKIPGYHLPTLRELASIFPYSVHLYFNLDYYETVDDEGVAVRRGNELKTEFYSAIYYSKASGVCYAIRFIGGDNSMRAAYRYKLYGTIDKHGSMNAGIRVSVCYLGSDFSGDMYDIANEDFWDSHNDELVNRDFPACGKVSSDPAGGIVGQGWACYYWATRDYDSILPPYLDFANYTMYISMHRSPEGKTVRLFKD